MQNLEINSFQKAREIYELDIHICNKIYYYIQAFIPTEKKQKKQQSRNVRRANGLKILMSQKERKRSKRSIIYITPEIPDQKNFESHFLHFTMRISQCS